MPTSDVTIDRAIGVLMWRHHLDEHQAFRWLVRTARDDGSAVATAAQDVLDQVVPPSDPDE